MSCATNGVDCDLFAQAMAALGPFEPQPTVAVGVSGGPDSMALALLLSDWARKRGGVVLALTVDHGLRPESGREAAEVARWLASRDIAHEILRWEGPKPQSGIQAAARRARYRLMAEKCAELGILHLAVAHHADDQAETVLLRSDRGSGAGGLAGMSASRSLGLVHLLRPLLPWPKAALVETCRAFNQATIDDPTNRADAFARTGLRARLAAGDEDRTRWLALARRRSRVRAGREHEEAKVLARVAEPRPDGAVFFDNAEFTALGRRLRQALLSAAIRSVGGACYPPSIDMVRRLEAAVVGRSFRGASLGGSAVRVWRNGLLICREAGRVAIPIAVEPYRWVSCRWVSWDGRYLLAVSSDRRDDDAVFDVGALGSGDYAALRRQLKPRIPAAIAASFPALRRNGRVIGVPSLNWSEEGAPQLSQRLAPHWPLAPERFTVVSLGTRIMCVTGQRTRGVRRSGSAVSEPSRLQIV